MTGTAVTYSARVDNCGLTAAATIRPMVRINGIPADMPNDVVIDWQAICPAPFTYDGSTGMLKLGNSYLYLKGILATAVFGGLQDCRGNSITPNSVLASAEDLQDVVTVSAAAPTGLPILAQKIYIYKSGAINHLYVNLDGLWVQFNI